MAKPEFEFTPTASVEFRDCTPHIDGLSEAILAQDSESDAVTRILKFEPGTDTSPNGALTHEFWEEVFIFEGSFRDLRLDRVFSAGDWATRPPGMEHGPWVSEEGAKMFEVRYYQ
ncbi:cupin domain-containing protein [Nesterenkonia sp. CL21]|uniref:cupin domain-containing protein n=1 Tax=Nesterenkonia sp. CL21 TaxID=3064894 RepID=UPI00287AE4C7|nr:cupin domain-containing protein [Nesterenkonia sp. CL21]MDS2174218.1 cupin domain-containing protein [Nesterenkonia sp. CL21]